MKIAVVTDDGVTISRHFGRALTYLVYTVGDDGVSGKETRPKASHHDMGGPQSHCHAPEEPHGHDQSAQVKHSAMVSNILDCQLVLAGGMGDGAHYSLVNAGITPYLTDIVNADDAVARYLGGTLPDMTDKVP